MARRAYILLAVFATLVLVLFAVWEFFWLTVWRVAASLAHSFFLSASWAFPRYCLVVAFLARILFAALFGALVLRLLSISFTFLT